MTALDQGRLTRRMDGNGGPLPSRFHDPVKGGVRIFLGALVALSTTGYAQPAAAGVGLVARGVALQEVNNTDGSDGDVSVETEAGCFPFENSSSTDEITDADIGKLCYIVDDQTVAKTSNAGARSVAGLVVQVDSRGVWVLVGVLPTASLQSLMVQQFEFVKSAADGAAGTATSETLFARVPRAGRILAAYFCPSAALTANDADYATLALAKRDGAGGASAAVASKTTAATAPGSGNWTAFVPVSLGTISNGTVEAGSVLTLAIAKAGNGVAVPSGTLVVIFEPG